MHQIIVNVTDKKEISNSFNNSIISDEFAEYLLKDSLSNSTLKIVFTHNFSTQDKLEINMMIKTYFETKLLNSNKKNHFEDQVELFLLVLGIILLVIYYLTRNLNILVLSEILLITGWVTIWEWAYKKIFTSNGLRFKIKKYKQLLKTNIEFLNNEKEHNDK